MVFLVFDSKMQGIATPLNTIVKDGNPTVSCQNRRKENVGHTCVFFNEQVPSRNFHAHEALPHEPSQHPGDQLELHQTWPFSTATLARMLTLQRDNYGTKHESREALECFWKEEMFGLFDKAGCNNSDRGHLYLLVY